MHHKLVRKCSCFSTFQIENEVHEYANQLGNARIIQ